MYVRVDTDSEMIAFERNGCLSGTAPLGLGYGRGFHQLEQKIRHHLGIRIGVSRPSIWLPWRQLIVYVAEYHSTPMYNKKL